MNYFRQNGLTMCTKLQFNKMARKLKCLKTQFIDQSNVIVYIRAYQPRDNYLDPVIFIVVGTKITAPYNVHWTEPTFK